MATDYIRGIDCRLYCSATIDTTDSGHTWTEIKRIENLSVNLGAQTVPTTTRDSTFETVDSTVKTIELTFDYMDTAATVSDAVFNLLKSSYVLKTHLLFWAADGAHDTTGTAGWQIPGLLVDFSISQDLGSVLRYNVSVAAVRATNTAGTATIDPQWVDTTPPPS